MTCEYVHVHVHIAPCTLHAWAWASKRRSQRAAAVQAGRANTAPTRTEPSNSPQPALQPIAAEQTDCTSTELHLRSNMQFPCATQRGAKQAKEGGKLKCESSAKDMGEQNFRHFTAYDMHTSAGTMALPSRRRCSCISRCQGNIQNEQAKERHRTRNSKCNSK